MMICVDRRPKTNFGIFLKETERRRDVLTQTSVTEFRLLESKMQFAGEKTKCIFSPS